MRQNWTSLRANSYSASDFFKLQEGEFLADDADPNAPQWRHPVLAVLLALVCVITVAGNCLVVVAVCTKKYLRNPTGYLVVSLAFADLIVGLVVMPLNSLFEMTRHVWLLGELPIRSECDSKGKK